MATDPAVNNIELHQRVNRTNTPQPDKILTEQTNAQTVTQEDGNAYAEGGYGWVIVFSSFWITFNFLGILYSWGVIQSALLDAGLSNARNLSIIGGLEAFFFSSSCIPSSHIIAYLGPRISAILGLTLSGLSLLLSSLSTHNLGGLIFLQGILFGISAGFLFMTVYPLPAQFFLRKRGLAMGLTSAGGGLGGAVWSIVIEKLIAKIGLPWTYRFQGFAMLLLCLPAALALRPGYTPPRPTLAPTGGRERSIFRQSMYIRVLVACLILSWPFFIPAFYIPQYSVSIGLTSAQGALNSAQYNIASGVGRITFGLLADYLVGPLTAWATALLLISLSSFFIWPYATNSAAVMGYSWVCGFGSGAHFSLQGSLVGLIVGSHKMHQGIGWIEMATSVGYLLGPITAGILLDEFGGPNAGAKPYRPAMYLIGATSMVAFAIAVWVKWSYTKQVWVTSSMLFFYLHALLAIPPTLNFFVLSFKPHLLPPAQIPHILRNYSALLLSTALITFTFILKPESDGWMAWALAVYHLAPITRAALRIESGEEIWTREMGGPGVHLGLHLIVCWGLLIRGIAGGTATPAELYGGSSN